MLGQIAGDARARCVVRVEESELPGRFGEAPPGQLPAAGEPEEGDRGRARAALVAVDEDLAALAVEPVERTAEQLRPEQGLIGVDDVQVELVAAVEDQIG